jgi:hypothetical protein
MFFDLLNNVLFNKNTSEKKLREGLDELSPFMINRWGSMYDGNVCVLINATTNRFASIFEDKMRIYRMFLHIIPRLGRKRINYIKKKKVETDEEDQELIDTLSRELELSKKEINMYIQYEREHRPTSTD